MRKDKSQKSKKVVTIPEIKIKKTSVQKIKNLKKNEKDNQEKLRRKLQRRNGKLRGIKRQTAGQIIRNKEGCAGGISGTVFFLTKLCSEMYK